MKLAVVFSIVFAVLVGQSQAQRYIGRYDSFRNGDEDRDSSKLPIPIISDKAAAAIVQGSNMLAEAAKLAVENEVYDKTGVLTAMKTFITGVNLMMNTLFTQISGAITTRITRRFGPGDALSDLITTVVESADGIKEIMNNLKNNIKPSEWSEIANAIEEIVDKVKNLDIFKPELRFPFNPFSFNQFGLTEPNYQGLDLETVISDWSTAIEGIANSVNTLAKAVQKVITSRTTAITVQKSIAKSVSLSGSFLSSVSTQLNSGLESVKTKLGQFSQTTIKQINQSFSSITSNPTKWYQRLLSQLFDFIASYSEYVNTEYLSAIASSFRKAERELATEIIEETRKTGLKITEVATYIYDRTAASSNPRASSVCSIKQIQKLMASTNSLNRLAQCVSVEASNIHGIYSQGQQLLSLAKDNAVSIVSQLSNCNTGSDKCFKKFSNIFDGMKDRAEDDLKAAGKQVDKALEAITKRIKLCLKVVAIEIETTSNKCQKDFDFCLKF